MSTDVAAGRPRRRTPTAAAGVAVPSPLIQVADLLHIVEDPATVLVEVDEDMGTYFLDHVPGAVGVSWLDDLQHPEHRGFIDGPAFAVVMDRLGISQDSHVVLLGDADNRYAALVYWYFAYYGHERLNLLDGGRKAWLDAGLALTDQETPPRRATGGYVAGRPRHELRATRDRVLAEYVGQGRGCRLIDCRSSAEHAGQVTGLHDMPLHRDRVTGHIPGSQNLPSTELVDPTTGRFLSIERLQHLFESRGVRPETEVVVYCRLADRSALSWFALHELVGHSATRHYEGGWAEYGSLVDVPVVTAKL